MAYKATDYQAAVKVLVEHGDITFFSQILDTRLAGIARTAAAAGLRREGFLKIMKDGLSFTEEQIRDMAAHFGIAVNKMKELIHNDPLYIKKDPGKQAK